MERITQSSVHGTESSLLMNFLGNISKKRMPVFAESHPEVFEEALTVSLTNLKIYAWRAAWFVNSAMDTDDLRVKPYINKILAFIPEAVGGHKRELLKILMRMNLNTQQLTKLFNLCSHLWKEIHLESSIRSTAMIIMLKIAENKRLLLKEITLLTGEPYFISLSQGIRRALIKRIRIAIPDGLLLESFQEMKNR